MKNWDNDWDRIYLLKVSKMKKWIVSKRLGAKTGSEVPSKESALSQWSRS